MPRMRITLPGGGVPWTKVPNALLDRIMPELRDTELRVLLVLVRQTAGWNREGSPVPLTYRQLIARTGRHGEAVGKALASLREKGLVHTPPKGANRKPAAGASETVRQQTKTGKG